MSPRGGKREGAGRPFQYGNGKADRISVSLDPGVASWLRAQSRDTAESVSAIVNAALEREWRRRSRRRA